MFLPPVQSPTTAPPRPTAPAPVTAPAPLRDVGVPLRERPQGSDPRPLGNGPSAFQRVAGLAGGELLTLGGRLDLYA